MPRARRIVIPGAFHHVTQRGNDRQITFQDDEDRIRYLELLDQQSAKHGLGVAGYCLMSNHVHLIVIPEVETSLARALGGCHWSYARYFNGRHGRSGHLWQGRYFSCPMDDAHAHNAMAYVELNPVRARLTRSPLDFKWSTARIHCGATCEVPILGANVWARYCRSEEWLNTLREMHMDNAALETVRRCTRTGKPLGRASHPGK